MQLQRCSATVRNAYSSWPCNRVARFDENGNWFCGLHAPSKIAERSERKKIVNEKIAREKAEHD